MIYNLCLPKKITKKKDRKKYRKQASYGDYKRKTFKSFLHLEVLKASRTTFNVIIPGTLFFAIRNPRKHYIFDDYYTLSGRGCLSKQINQTCCILVNWCSVLMKTDVLIKLKGGRSRNMKQNIVVNLRVTTYPTYCLHVIFMWPPFSSSLLTFILLCNSNILLVDCSVNYCFIGACTIQVCSNFPRAICM